MTTKRYRQLFFALSAAVFIFRLWFIRTLPLSGDESYHWEWSRNLAFGYYDHPGLTAYLIRLSTWLFGRSTEFTVRLPALVMLTTTSVICYMLARIVGLDRGNSDLEAERAGFVAGTLIVIIPVFSFFAVYISTDPPVICFWSMSLYFFYRAFREGKRSLWITAGIVLGLAMMCKFLAFFLIPPLVLFALLSADSRKFFKKPHPYIAALSALLVFAPFLLWNATHHWATFMFNFVYRQGHQGLDIVNVPIFVVTQALLALTPGLFIFAVFGLWQSITDWRQQKCSSALFLGLSSIVPLLYFFILSFRRPVGFHWATCGWIGIIVYISCFWSEKWKAKRKFANWSLVMCCIMTVFMHSAVHIPPKWIKPIGSVLGIEAIDRLEEFSGERYGWRSLGECIVKIRDEMSEEQHYTPLDFEKHSKKERLVGTNGVFVICSQYGLASNVSFYSPGQFRTHLWSTRRVHGMNYTFWDDFVLFKGMDALYVTKDQDSAREAFPRLMEHFEYISKGGYLSIVGETDGEKVRSFYIVKCYRFNGEQPVF